jgi:hypothetical protein
MKNLTSHKTSFPYVGTACIHSPNAHFSIDPEINFKFFSGSSRSKYPYEPAEWNCLKTPKGYHSLPNNDKFITQKEAN